MLCPSKTLWADCGSKENGAWRVKGESKTRNWFPMTEGKLSWWISEEMDRHPLDSLCIHTSFGLWIGWVRDEWRGFVRRVAGLNLESKEWDQSVEAAWFLPTHHPSDLKCYSNLFLLIYLKYLEKTRWPFPSYDWALLFSFGATQQSLWKYLQWSKPIKAPPSPPPCPSRFAEVNLISLPQLSPFHGNLWPLFGQKTSEDKKHPRRFAHFWPHLLPRPRLILSQQKGRNISLRGSVSCRPWHIFCLLGMLLSRPFDPIVFTWYLHFWMCIYNRMP